MNDFTFAHREEGFDNHIDKSIRGYKELLNDVVSFSRYFVEEKTHVLDIGCSTGKLTKEIFLQNHEHKNRVTYEGVEYAKGFKKIFIGLMNYGKWLRKVKIDHLLILVKRI